MEYKLLINGELVDGAGTMPVLNPATEEILADCPTASEDQLNEAVTAAQSAFEKWKETSLDERRAKLGEIADIIDAHSDELARSLTQEQGKPLEEAMVEISGAANVFPVFSIVGLASRGFRGQRDPTGRGSSQSTRRGGRNYPMEFSGIFAGI